MRTNNITNYSFCDTQSFGNMSRKTEHILLKTSRVLYESIDQRTDINRVFRQQIVPSSLIDVSLSYLLPWRSKIILFDRVRGTKTKFSLNGEFDTFINSAVHTIKESKPAVQGILQKLNFSRESNLGHGGWYFKDDSATNIAERIYILGLNKGKKAEEKAIELFNQIERNNGGYSICYDNKGFLLGRGLKPIKSNSRYIQSKLEVVCKIENSDNILKSLKLIDRKLRKLISKDQKEFQKAIKQYDKERGMDVAEHWIFD